MAANPYRVGAIIGRGSGKLEEAQTIADAVQPLLIAGVSCRLVVIDHAHTPTEASVRICSRYSTKGPITVRHAQIGASPMGAPNLGTRT